MPLDSLIQDCLNAQNLIGEERKQALNALSQIINQSLAEKAFADIICICTHNSRRSQLAEWWIRQARRYFDIQGINVYSGGTENTAFNIRMVRALESFGISFQCIEDGDNPKYLDCNGDEQLYFSKTYNDPFNPQKDFIAMMVCDHADTNCPVVTGAAKRFSLPYIDPKNADDTDNEESAYREKVLEIGREMLYVMQSVNQITQA